MTVYSLINSFCDRFCVGIYTSLDNLYVALKDCVKRDFEYYTPQEMKEYYEIFKLTLDNEPLECFEFTTHGNEITIDWEKVFA